MPNRIQVGLYLLVLPAIILAFAPAISAQVNPPQLTNEQFRKMLRDDAAFNDGDLEMLDKGEAVVKSLKVSEKNEVAVCGAVRIERLTEISMQMFADSLAPPKDGTVRARGKFSMPPVVGDLKAFKFEKREIADLRKCRIGDCKLNLSAAMIDSFQNGVDWNANDFDDRLNALFAQKIVDYVHDYRERGNAALFEYAGRKEPLDLADEHRILLDKALFLKDLAPEFVRYLKNEPPVELPGIESEIYWSKLTFGLDPMFTVTDTARYLRRDGGSPEYLIATKQIYASRYADSSLALSFLVSVAAGSQLEYYIVFSDLSRSESLRGLFGGFKRSVVGGEASVRVREILQRSKERLENPVKEASITESISDDTTLLQSTLEEIRNPWILASLVALIAIGTYLTYRRFTRS